MPNKYLTKIAAISSLAEKLGKGVIPEAGARANVTKGWGALKNARSVGEDIKLSNSTSMVGEDKAKRAATEAYYNRQSNVSNKSQGFKYKREYLGV